MTDQARSSGTHVAVVCSVCDKPQGYSIRLDPDVQEYAIICVECQEKAKQRGREIFKETT